MVNELATNIGAILLSYTGPEPERVRTAIGALAKDDLVKARYYLERANQDYRDILWWAERDAEEERKIVGLGGMTVNERLSHLNLMPEFDAAVGRGDAVVVKALLRRCQLKEPDIEIAAAAALRRG